MKNFSVLFFILVAFPCFLAAQIPQTINYQAVLRDNAGQVLASRNVSLRISVLQNTPTGATVYRETHLAETSNQGIVNVQIGNGTSEDDFTSIEWMDSPYFLKIELDMSGGNSFVDLGTSELISVPYAFAAGKVASEADPLFSTSPAQGITPDNVGNWNSAYSWGNHANAGYLTATSSATLTNKSGNISMFTNDAGYTVLPTLSGNSGKFLTNNGSNTSWSYAVNSADSPLSISNNVISLSKSGSSSNGYLSADDWNMFNNKITSPWSVSGDNLYYNSGNIGLGTTNPLGKLNIVSNVSVGEERAFIRLKNESTSPTASVSIALQAYNNKGATFGYTAGTYTINDLADFGVFTTSGRGFAIAANTGQIRFYTNLNPDGSYSEKMRITEAGNIGVGTTNPTSRLQVADGDIYISDINQGVIMKSPDGQCWRGTLNNEGILSFVKITCP